MEKYKDKIQKEYHLVRSEIPVYQELRTFFFATHVFLHFQDHKEKKALSCTHVF